MDPDKWGPHAWIYLHSVTMSYPEHPTYQHKQQMKSFFENLWLPCHDCMKHYKKHLEELPLSDTILESRENLVKWCIDIHNKVNQLNNKKIISYEDAIKHYNKMYSNAFDIKTLLYAIIIILVCVLVFKKFTNY